MRNFLRAIAIQAIAGVVAAVAVRLPNFPPGKGQGRREGIFTKNLFPLL